MLFEEFELKVQFKSTQLTKTIINTLRKGKKSNITIWKTNSSKTH